MTDIAKPTTGPWDVQEHGFNERLIPFSIFGNLSSEKKNWVLIAKLYSTGPLGADCSERNAALIAEAGTVYHETNLTPRQLLERVRLLENALDAALNWLVRPISSHIDHENPEDNDPIYQQVVEVMRAAIGKHGEKV